MLTFLHEINFVVCLVQMFANATGIDYLYMSVGTFGALVSGISIPIFNVLMGRMLNNLNDSPNSFQDAVAKICIIFVILAGITLCSGFLQVCAQQYLNITTASYFKFH